MSGAGTAAYLLLSACIVPEYRMSFQSLRSRKSAVFVARSLVAGVLLVPAGGLAAPGDDLIAVNVDQAKLVKFPEKISTIVVGNPMIADVTLQAGGVVVVTGKGYGATNVIALDRTGSVLMDRVIQVEGPTDKVITVYRGTSRESYSCAPNCERRVTLGDGEVYFKSTIEQAGTLSGQASAAGATTTGAAKNN
jgi:Flp pilus assembly secretin CpaC